MDDLMAVLRRFQRGTATWWEAMEALMAAFPNREPDYLEAHLRQIDREARAILRQYQQFGAQGSNPDVLPSGSPLRQAS